MTQRLTDKIVVVTGSAQGIGAAYARRLYADGATVVLADLKQEAVEATAAALTESGPGTATALPLDVSDRASCQALADQLTAAYGKVDGVVNNAAIFSTIEMKPFWEITDADWDQLMAVNLRGPWLLISTLLPLLRAATSASVVNIGSDAVLMGRPGYLHYVASKGGVHGMTYSMAKELGEFGIRVNTLSPGPVYTEIDRGTVTPQQREAMLAAQDLHRPAGPDDMTGTASFLLSDDAAYLTGQTISVNGGLIHR
ncbi:2-hydroxycyclohexanecarboxyl-CoA dehydrogenase [Enemella evansiae]|uniref:SDR family NAD(P)-dependent oxidoreductase n=1 Tax=Enemella evansiae TaxID=2016499 RepID=UPI000B95D0C0|nr:SDR family oxidoreductase [Enemella evansiae]OYO04816.1 2-hydroxycyclohexanecarboxyl-CoA dehydrogenase [Enemella evansiae]